MGNWSSVETPDKSELLARYSSEAQQLEKQGEPRRAIERWQQALALLPKEAAQAVWIREHIKALEAAHPSAGAGQWIRRLGPLAPIALFIAKFKFLFVFLLKFKFLFSLFAFLGFYWALFGWRFGLGFAALVMIHEMGHYIDVKRRGLPAELPVFLPGLGAYVRWQALGVSLETRAEISLAGPFAGLLASAACAVIFWRTGYPLWAALASVGAWLNALNLIPIFMLDGGQAVLALNRVGRGALIVISVAIAYITGQLTFYLIAAGAAYRVFTAIREGDEPQESSTRILFFYTALLAALALLMHSMPGHGSFSR
jgi:Zn-dependent protease